MENVGSRADWPPYTDINKARERLILESKKTNQFALVLKSENKIIGSA